MVLTSLQKLFPYTLIQYDTERDEPIRDANGLCVKTPRGETFCSCSFNCFCLHQMEPGRKHTPSTRDEILRVGRLGPRRAATNRVAVLQVRRDCWCPRSLTLPPLSATPRMSSRPRGRDFVMFSEKEIFTSTAVT